MSKFNAMDLVHKLKEELNTQYVNVDDDSDGCGAKFSATIVSEVFVGKTLLEKHRLVNKALAEELKEIHAFSQKTYTPEEWEKVKPKEEPKE
ncbi:uncharacterized protein [Drosophila bipectinata]|uniref:uncharacterized protein n=1 Tax=Drosophila bipectinata TaxID=42026 RepID=UPI0007E60B6F|nr:uncharacterized bolA-like protein C8C9.11 [Drosophila bipectinata]